MYLHRGLGNVHGGARFVDELVELVEPHPTGTEAKDEKHALDEVRLARTVRPHHARETAVERTDHLPPRVRLEVLKHHVVDDEAGRLFPPGLDADAHRQGLCPGRGGLLGGGGRQLEEVLG